MTGRLIINKMLLINTLRYFIASVLFLTGLGKLLDIPGFVMILGTYQAIPEWGLHIVAVVIVLLELKICEWLLRSETLVSGARYSFLFHSFYTIWNLITLVRGIPVENCGCFGVFFGRPLSGWTVIEDLVLVVVSWTLLFLTIKQKKKFNALVCD